LNATAETSGRELVIALTGNPNSGKTTIFNRLTGSHQRVGNWGGVTVERLDGWLRHNRWAFRITDLPGMYSLSAGSPDEAIARDFIVHGVGREGRPDLVVQVIDGGSLERSLLLTMQLLVQEIPLVIVLNMHDEVQRRGLMLDPKRLSERLGVPVIPTVGNRGEGMDDLIAAIESSLDGKSLKTHRYSVFDPATEELLEDIQHLCASSGKAVTRGYAVGLLTGEPDALERLDPNLQEKVKQIVQEHSPGIGATWADAITHARYAAISKLLAGVVGVVSSDRLETQTAHIDAVLIHRIWGLPLFLVLMLLLFELTFAAGAYPMAWIDSGMSQLAGLVRSALPMGFLSELIADGIISGAGFVLVFLPNVLILLMGIYILEDSGYMARAAFLMDRVMRLMGLHGRSFIPMMMGFGCTVPAMLASRTLESRRDRILTMLVTPLMSCSARLPIYVMVTAAFFPRNGGLVIFGLYFLGLIAAVLLGRLFGRTVLRGQAAPFIMELPPYRWPTLNTTLFRLKFLTMVFLKRIGLVVLPFAVGIWFFSSFPRPGVEAQAGDVAGTHPYSETTYIHKVGSVLEPVMQPLGFNIPMDIALVSGFVAKEIVVATMGVLFTGQEGAEDEVLVEQLRRGIPSPAVALAFLVFVLLYTPCLTTIITIQRESRRWYWTAFSILYQTSVAYLGAFVTLNVATWLGLG